MSIELGQLLRTTRRWWWVLLVVPLLGASLGIAITSIQARRYDATATVLVTPSREPGIIAFDDVQAGNQLAATYAYLARSRPVLSAAIEALGEPAGGEVEIGKRVSTRVVPELPVIEIVVSDAHPERAAVIANAVAEALTQRIRDDAAALVEPARAEVAAQIEVVDAEIVETAARLRSLETNSTPDNAAERDMLAREIERRIDSLASLEETATDLDLRKATDGTEATTWARAAPPTEPAAPRRSLLAVLGGLAGLMIAGGGIVLAALQVNPVRVTDAPAVVG